MFFPLLVRQVLRVLGVPVVLASLRTHLAVGARLLENSAVWKEEAEAELVGLVSFEWLFWGDASRADRCCTDERERWGRLAVQTPADTNL